MELIILVFGFVVPVCIFGIIMALKERNARGFSFMPRMA